MSNKTEKPVTHKKSSVEELLANTEAGAIWSEIKDKNIDMFSLPDQKIHKYCQPRFVEPSKLYLVTSATASLPSLETALGKNFSVELIDKYIVVSRAVVPLTKK